MEDKDLIIKAIAERIKEEQRKQSATMANQTVAETEAEEQKKSMEDIPLGSQIIQESQEIVDKVGAMERNEENEKGKENNCKGQSKHFGGKSFPSPVCIYSS